MSEHKPNVIESIRRSGVGIGLFAVLAAGIIATTQVNTKEIIAANQAEAAARALFEIYPATIDANLYQNKMIIEASSLGYTEAQPVYQAQSSAGVEGVILPVRTTEGYSGDIDLLVGINQDGSIGGVRVVNHRETPGLGDAIDLSKSDWVLSFNGRTRSAPDDKRWAVRKDGGDFDQFTGATITPRAVVAATAKALDFFEANSTELLQPVKP